MKKLAIVTATSILLVSGFAYAENNKHSMGMHANKNEMQTEQMNMATMMRNTRQLESRIQALESQISEIQKTHVQSIDPQDPVYDD